MSSRQKANVKWNKAEYIFFLFLDSSSTGSQQNYLCKKPTV